MHHLLEIIEAVLNVLTIPWRWPTRRPKWRKPSQMEEAQHIISLTLFGMFVVIGGVICLANFFAHR